MTIIAKHLRCDSRDICSQCSIYLWPPKTDVRVYYYCPTCNRDILCDRGLVQSFVYDEDIMAESIKPLCLNCRGPVEERWWPEGTEAPKPIEITSDMAIPNSESSNTPVQINPTESMISKSNETPSIPAPGTKSVPTSHSKASGKSDQGKETLPPPLIPPVNKNPIGKKDDNLPPPVAPPVDVVKQEEKTITCPHCGAILPFKVKKCLNCLKEIPWE